MWKSGTPSPVRSPAFCGLPRKPPQGPCASGGSGESGAVLPPQVGPARSSSGRLIVLSRSPVAPLKTKTSPSFLRQPSRTGSPWGTLPQPAGKSLAGAPRRRSGTPSPVTSLTAARRSAKRELNSGSGESTPTTSYCVFAVPRTRRWRRASARRISPQAGASTTAGPHRVAPTLVRLKSLPLSGDQPRTASTEISDRTEAPYRKCRQPIVPAVGSASSRKRASRAARQRASLEADGQSGGAAGYTGAYSSAGASSSGR